MTDAEKALQAQIDRLQELHPDIFPTEASVWTKLRGDLRRGIWEKSPAKIAFKNSTCSHPPDGYTGRAKSGTYCALCGQWEGKSKLEVDHKKGNVPLRCPEDVLYFIAHMLSSGDQLQLVQKQCHRTKSYADRQGISFEEAVVTKRVIEMEKNKTLTKWIEDNGQVPASNAKARRQQAIEMMQEKG